MKNDNVECTKCGKFYSQLFVKCPYCCDHNELHLIEEWNGPDEGGGWGLEAVCSECGKNYDFNRNFLIDNYKLIRKKS